MHDYSGYGPSAQRKIFYGDDDLMMLDDDLRAGILFIKIVLIPFYVMFTWVFISIGEFTPVQNIVDDPCTLLLLMAAIASVFFIPMDVIELIRFVKEKEDILVMIKIMAIVSSVVMVCLSIIALMKLTGF